MCCLIFDWDIFVHSFWNTRCGVPDLALIPGKTYSCVSHSSLLTVPSFLSQLSVIIQISVWLLGRAGLEGATVFLPLLGVSDTGSWICPVICMHLLQEEDWSHIQKETLDTQTLKRSVQLIKATRRQHWVEHFFIRYGPATSNAHLSKRPDLNEAWRKQATSPCSLSLETKN